MQNDPVTRRQATADAAFCLALGAAYVCVGPLHLPVRWVMIVLGIAIVGFAVVIWKRGTETWADFGLTKKNLRAACLSTLFFTALCGAGICVVGVSRGVPLWHQEFLILMPLYPLYGLGQQLLTQGVFHRRILQLTRSRTLSVILTALTFGMVHASQPLLAALCTLGGLGWALIFQRYRNLWPLGVSHGVLGAMTYAIIFDKNPLKTL